METITLPPELEKIISEKARQQGTSPELLVLDELREKHLPDGLQARQEYMTEKYRKGQHPQRAQLDADEALRRMEAFTERKEQIIADVRALRRRDVSS